MYSKVKNLKNTLYIWSIYTFIYNWKELKFVFICYVNVMENEAMIAKLQSSRLQEAKICSNKTVMGTETRRVQMGL